MADSEFQFQFQVGDRVVINDGINIEIYKPIGEIIGIRTLQGQPDRLRIKVQSAYTPHYYTIVNLDAALVSPAPLHHNIVSSVPDAVEEPQNQAPAIFQFQIGDRVFINDNENNENDDDDDNDRLAGEVTRIYPPHGGYHWIQVTYPPRIHTEEPIAYTIQAKRLTLAPATPESTQLGNPERLYSIHMPIIQNTLAHIVIPPTDTSTSATALSFIDGTIVRIARTITMAVTEVSTLEGPWLSYIVPTEWIKPLTRLDDHETRLFCATMSFAIERDSDSDNTIYKQLHTGMVAYALPSGKVGYYASFEDGKAVFLDRESILQPLQQEPQVGDTAIIIGRQNERPRAYMGLLPAMEEYVGQIATITKVNEFDTFDIDLDNQEFYWEKTWLRLLPTQPALNI